MKQPNAWISCTRTDRYVHSFYLTVDDEKLFLFSQPYRRSVHHHFRNGVRLRHALDFSRSGSDYAVMHTMRKLPIYIKYLEKEYDLPVLDQTRRRQNERRTRSKKIKKNHALTRSKHEKIDFGRACDYMMAS